MGEDTRRPCLEHRPDTAADPVRTGLSPLPFRIGRSRQAELVLGSPRVSKLHAEIDRADDGFVVRDLDSRNGTFVNGERVETERPLRYGDVLHVANRELKLVLADPDGRGTDDSPTMAGVSHDEADFYRATRDLYRILAGRTVCAVFQPITRLDDGSVVGYEALGRHTLARVDYDATTLFRIAHERGRAEELSRMMRAATVADIPQLPRAGERLFMNVHPAEMESGTLLDDLAEAAEALGPGRHLVAEIHEAAITHPTWMGWLKSELSARNIELAYDDFGAGHSRLMELAEVPPDFLKLDMRLIRGIDESPGRQELFAALVKVLREAGVAVIAEGIETLGEHRTCRELGCELGQGFLMHHPLPVDDLRDTWS